jgi:uncharacterized phiE125 gp8 family phage protein
MRLEQITPPAAEPLTLSEAKAYLRVTSTDEDALITGFIAQAREWAESYMSRALIEQTWELRLDAFPRCGNGNPDAEILLPLGRTQSVTWIKYIDGDGNEQTLTGASGTPTGTDYQEDFGDDYGGVVRAKFGETWPAVQNEVSAVKVRFVAGYGAASSAIPAGILSGVQFRVADLYATRGQQDLGTRALAGRWTDVAKSLLYNKRARFF